MSDSVLDQAWSLTGDLAALKKLLGAAATKNAEIALALARFEVLDKSVGESIEAEGSAAFVVPLALAQALAAPEPRAVISSIEVVFRVMDDRAKPALRELANKCQSQAAALSAKAKHDAWTVRFWQQGHAYAVGALARLGDTRDAEAMCASHKWMLRVLVPHGIGIDDAIAQLENVVDDENPLREAMMLLPALVRSGNPKFVPAMIKLLRSGIAIHALGALAATRDPRAIEPARELLRETGGDDDDVGILTLAAQAVLWQHGETFPLDRARRAIGWPIIRYRTFEHEALLLRALGIEALRIGGTPADRDLARAQVQSPYRVVRDAALKAFDAPPKLTGWDKGRVAWAKTNDPNALAAALEDPHAFFVHLVAKELVKDEKAKASVLAFVTKRIESMPPPYNEKVERDADMNVCIEVAQTLAKGAEKKAFEKSTSPWIHVSVLEEDEDAYVAKDDAIAPSPRPATVTRFDRPANFFPGARFVALAANAERMVVIAPESFVFDPQKSERVMSLGSGEGVVAGAISADGARIALARETHVEIREGARTEIANVTALAFSADGASLACGSANKLCVIDASGKETFSEDSPGACRGVAWLTPTRVVFLVDKGKKSALVDVDVKKKKRADVAVAPSTLLASHGKLLATAGGKSLRLHDAKLGTKVEAECAEAIVGLAVESEKALIAATESKLVRARIGGKAPKVEDVSRVAVKFLAANGARIYGWSDGSIQRFHDDDAGRNAAGSHSAHVTGAHALPDGRIVTTGWEGRVLLWKPEGGVAETLFDRKERVDHLAVAPDGSTIYFDDGRNLRAVDVSSRTMKCLVGGEDVEADLAEHMPEVEAIAASKSHVAWAGGKAIHVIDLATGDEAFTMPGPHEAFSFDGAGNLYASGKHGELACFDAKGVARWSRIEHGIDVIDGELHGNPHRNIAAIATRKNLLATLGSDDNVRVFDAVTGVRKMRWFRRVGIFNDLDISPNGKLVAFTWDTTFEIVDIAKVESVVLIDASTWPGGADLMAVTWVDDHTLVVGSESGALFRITF